MHRSKRGRHMLKTLRQLALGALLTASLAAPALAQNNFPTTGGATVPGFVTMCIVASVATPCPPGTTVGGAVTGGSSGCVLFDTSTGTLGCNTTFTSNDAGTQILFPGGSAAVPGIALSPTVNTGLYSTGAFIQLSVQGTNIASFTASAFQEATNNTIGWANTAGWKTLGVGTIQQGGADVAAPTAQVYRTQGVVAGTSNTAGTDFTIAVSPGTGTGAGGRFIVQTAPAHGSDTVQGTLTNVFSINSAGNMAATFNAATGTNAVCNTPGTLTAVTVQVWATGCAASSARFKDGIAAINREKAFEAVLGLDPVSYFYKPEFNMGSDKHIGFTAEQVATVDPFLVTFEDDGVTPHAVKYNEMAPLFAAAIQQLKADNDNLRAEIEDLKRRVR